MDYSAHAMHYRKEIWGDDAKEFPCEIWEKRRAGRELLPASLSKYLSNSIAPLALQALSFNTLD